MNRWINSGFSVFVLVLLGITPNMAVFAENIPISAPESTPGAYAMLGWVGTTSIVEQVQTIHRLSQSTSPDAIEGLVSALSSPYPLARRKASQSLLKKACSVDENEKFTLSQSLRPALENKDPVVQQNVVLTVASLETPQSKETLRQFFKSASKQQQLNAVEALCKQVRYNKGTLQIVNQSSPYPEVRQVATDNLHTEN